MDAAVSLHHGALPLPLPVSVPPAHHNHCRTLPIPLPHHPSCPSVSSSSSSKPPAARLQVQPALPLPARSTHGVVLPAAAAPRHSSRAATGYAAALADACVRAGTLHRAYRHARALILSSTSRRHEDDARVDALVRMLVGKGKAEMVAEVMAEFAAICDHLLPRAARA